MEEFVYKFWNILGFYSFVLGIEYFGFVVLVLYSCVCDQYEFGIGIWSFECEIYKFMSLLEIGWFVGFISCFPSIDGDWIWLLGLFLGFGKNMKNKLLCSYEKIIKSKNKKIKN